MAASARAIRLLLVSSSLIAAAWAARLEPEAHVMAEVKGEKGAVWASYDEVSGRFTAHKQPPNGGSPAKATYSHASNHPSNFGQVRVHTNPLFSNKVQMQAAGFVEGYITAETISTHWYNWKWWLLHKTNDAYKIFDWLKQHHQWVQQQLSRLEQQPPEERPFWEALSLVMGQWEGMMLGYNARVQEEGPQLGINFISLEEWLTLNTMGDMDDLLEILFPKDPAINPVWEDMEPAQLRAHLAQRGRCSVLIKVTPDLSDLLLGHVTWWTYTGMTRLYKHYTFNLRGKQYKTRTTSMSSYPGMISSMDDFYILDSGLVVTETSNDVLDKSLWSKVVPQAALSWQRVLVANLLAADGPQWAHWIQQHNSGTYNNQYMVVNLNSFQPGQELERGLLTVVEQIPGMVVWDDKTQALERGYWPSYNVPYFPDIYNASGYPSAVKRLKLAGPQYNEVVAGLSYQLAPRAEIARRDMASVVDLHSLKRYLRGNAWESDPLSGGSPWGAQCARGDLDPTAPAASGCNDAKVTSYRLARRNAAEAVNGPTKGQGANMGAFAWRGKWEEVAHRGMPEVFDFEFERQEP